MSRSLGTLTLDLVAKVGGWTEGWSKAEREAKTRSKSIERTMSNLKNTIGGVLAAFGGGVLASAIIRNTVAAENQLAQLTAALRSTGEAAGYSRDQLVSMASDFAKATTFSQGEIIDAQTRLLTYSSIVGEQYPAALQAAIDQSARLGISLTQSAEIIGRALETPSRGVASLTRQGFNFTDQQRKLLKSLEDTGRMAEAQAIVLDVLAESYGGAAAAARDTFGGAMKAVQNSFNDLLTANDGLPAATSALNEFSDMLRDPSTVAAANTLTSAVVTGFTKITEAILGTVNVTKFWAEELAARLSGPAYDDVVRISDEIERIQKILDSNPWSDSEWLNRITLFGENGLVEWWSDEELRKRLETLKKQLNDAMSGSVLGTAGTTGGAGGGVVGSAPSYRNSAFDDLIHEVRIDAPRYDEFQENKQFEQSMAEYRRLLEENYQYSQFVSKEAMEGINSTSREMMDQLKEHFDGVGDQFDELMDKQDEMTVFADQAARNMQTAFADFLFDPFDDGIKGMLKGFVDVIRRMVAEAAAAKIFKALFGEGEGGSSGAGNWLGALIGAFGGGKAMGGPLESGKWYIAGEYGPEPIWGGGPGAFAAGYGGLSKEIHVTNNITFNNVRDLTDEKMAVYAQRISDATVARIRDDRRRGVM